MNREFQNLYNTKADASLVPKIFQGAGTPAFAPSKIGDEYVDTTNKKIYFSTATATSASWLIVN